MADLTVLILTKNEEKNLRKCVESFRGLARRFVVVDSYSTDQTVSLAKELGADVYENPWVNYATQFNWGLANTDITTKWTMRFDADEELTPELAKELEERLSGVEEDVVGVECKRRIHFLHRWIRHGGIYPTWVLRIFRTGKAYCEKTVMDEHIMVDEGKVIRFDNDFIDNNTKDIAWWIDKHNWYSDREVVDYISKKSQLDEGSVLKPDFWGNQAERKRWIKYMVYYKTPFMRRAHWYFLYRYFIKLGFLDGKEGLIYHFLQGYWYRFLVDAKLYEYQNTDVGLKDSGALKS
ncbi:MAG: glycosyltransferase family 2 protein [Lachnospiraceae bacterium]|jgi:glycosyltransferase involved in cell wall biosynthesis|nr:glycosyltransferase family 2 protein [Lachnospiraceae bacterium]